MPIVAAPGAHGADTSYSVSTKGSHHARPPHGAERIAIVGSECHRAPGSAAPSSTDNTTETNHVHLDCGQDRPTPHNNDHPSDHDAPQKEPTRWPSRQTAVDASSRQTYYSLPGPDPRATDD